MLMLYNLITVTIVLIWFKSNILLDRIWWNQTWINLDILDKTKESFYSIYSSIIYCCCCAVKGGTFTTTILREDVCKLEIRQRVSSRMTHRFRKAVSMLTHTHTHARSHIVSLAGLTNWWLTVTDKRFIPSFFNHCMMGASARATEGSIHRRPVPCLRPSPAFFVSQSLGLNWAWSWVPRRITPGGWGWGGG